MELLDFVEKYLVAKEARCYRHCSQSAKFAPVYESESSLVGAYVCPDKYVSRAVYFSDKPDEEWFYSFLSAQLGSDWVRKRDIRVATRFGWELRGNAEDEIKEVSKSGKLVQYYWSFRPENNEERSRGTFLCSNCGKFYVKPKTGDSPCPHCGKS